jgi:NAD(P)-dependent dehydrogenase (short-subunit alcohol dehydrogenase family)
MAGRVEGKAAVVVGGGQTKGETTRANAILLGLMNTPMAIEARVAQGVSREEVVASRDRRVPLRRRMGTGWDVAYAARYLHSDEAGFVTGVALAVDGGEGVSWGS